ncbi:DMT family transporter [Myroides phaeus]|uniref:EamA domain-containing membrane protein RarD n=1 Tax=Myroides phaeus TaxID=702745 RepID=A0A1G8BPP2_9FLAO|nr:EamA family transporter [Myroides phaeus]MEC4116108.1 EamA family transporter [Myroides phaeus]SDH35216.1 EamA domain-containing membrane protein RarD [Myroides phaeus]
MKNLKGIFFALISSGTFGLVPLFSLPLIVPELRPEGVAAIGIPTILFYRFLFSSATMGAVCVYKKTSLKIAIKDLAVVFFLALLYAATAKFIVDSYEYIASGLATTVHFLYPIFVSIVMILFYKEKKSIVLLIASVLSLLGVGMMCWHGEPSPALFKGLVLASITIFTYGLYIVGLNKSRIADMNFDSLTFYVLLMGCLIFLFYCLVTTGIEPITLSKDWMNLILLGFFATFISDLCLVLAVKHAGSTITSILGSMEPVVAVLVGTLFFAEHFDFISGIGLMFVLLSVTLVILFNKKPT